MKFFSRRTASSVLSAGTRSAGGRLSIGSERGAALVETAVILPLLLLVLMGTMAFGLALNNYLVLTNAAALGAQQVAISRGQTTDPCATAAAAVYTAAPYLTRGSIGLTLGLNIPAGSTTPGFSASAASCPTTTAINSMIQGTGAQLTLTYPCTLSIVGVVYSCALTAQTAEVMQ